MEDTPIPAPEGSKYNENLYKLYWEDQKDRLETYTDDSLKLWERDKDRYEQALSFYDDYKNDSLELTPADKFHLSMLFQHGQDSSDYKRAWELSEKSAQEGDERAKWLSCASEDRYLLSIGKKQRWGTQYKAKESGGLMLQPMLSDEESGITDQMRLDKNVPIRSVSERRVS